jgi:tetratricopeptide (TPR) repeat protein
MGNTKLQKALDEGGDFAFLSSLCKEIEVVRKGIYDRINSDSCPTMPIYLDDEYIRRNTEPVFSIQIANTDDFINVLSRSKLVIVIFNKAFDTRETDHGSLLVGTTVSFWEIELFHAAMLGKPIYAIVEKGFEYQERPFLYHILEILNLSAVKIYEEERDDIAKRVEGILMYPGATNSLNVKKYLSRLDWKRSIAMDKSSNLFDTTLSSSNWFVKNSEINEDIIYDNIANIDQESNYQARITRLYLSYRELLKAHYKNPAFERFLPAWNIHSQKMAEALAWYGAHGHQQLGVINHNIDLAEVRHIIRERRVEQFAANDIEFPAGGLASAYYSLHRLSGKHNLDKAIYYTNIGLLQENTGKDGLFAIRGSCYMNQFKFWSALDDYKAALKEKEKRHADQHTIADSKSELSLGYFFTGRIVKALNLYKEASEEFTKDDGFKIRSLRKGAFMYKCLFKYSKARECLEKAKRISTSQGAFDQLRQLMQ